LDFAWQFLTSCCTLVRLHWRAAAQRAGAAEARAAICGTVDTCTTLNIRILKRKRKKKKEEEKNVLLANFAFFFFFFLTVIDWQPVVFTGTIDGSYEYGHDDIN
jgi:hypothetical protein